MDTRRIDENGLVVCPSCGKHYKPVLGEKDQNMCIQDQFPKATAVEREQLLTGLCSQKCWNDFLGLPPFER